MSFSRKDFFFIRIVARLVVLAVVPGSDQLWPDVHVLVKSSVDLQRLVAA